jgi:hypothetical protein
MNLKHKQRAHKQLFQNKKHPELALVEELQQLEKQFLWLHK